jgi:hypothetical protein
MGVSVNVWIGADLGCVPLVLDWNDGGEKVAVAGTFTGWRKRVNLRRTYLSKLDWD